MTITNLGWVFLGGGIGSVLRFALGWWIPESGGFPWATFWVNILSCVVIGGLMAAVPALGDQTRLLLITGFCGGLSTFSTFSRETVQLVDRGEWGIAVSYVLSSVLIGSGILFLVWRGLVRS